MCTSLTLSTRDGRLFGRTLDLDNHFGEDVVLTPCRYRFSFHDMPSTTAYYALLGMATVEDGYPLYAEAMNQKGLCMAGLRFAGNARYADGAAVGKVNLAPWELIPYLLGRYTTVNEVRNALREIRVVGWPYSEKLPAAPLHWHVADADPTHGELVVEVTADGMAVYENPVGVLTNNPPFPYQLMAYASYARLSARPSAEGETARRVWDVLRADPASLGTGGLGMPGDYSSTSRFVRAATLRRWVSRWMHACPEDGDPAGPGGETCPVNQFFRILAAVSPMAGAVLTREGRPHRTLYTCCMDGRTGAYHYFTEADSAVRTVRFSEGINEETCLTVF